MMLKMTITSGIRLEAQAATTRGFGLNEFKKVGELITKVIEGLSKIQMIIVKLKMKLKKKLLNFVLISLFITI